MPQRDAVYLAADIYKNTSPLAMINQYEWANICRGYGLSLHRDRVWEIATEHHSKMTELFKRKLDCPKSDIVEKFAKDKKLTVTNDVDAAMEAAAGRELVMKWRDINEA